MIHVCNLVSTNHSVSKNDSFFFFLLWRDHICKEGLRKHLAFKHNKKLYLLFFPPEIVHALRDIV